MKLPKLGLRIVKSALAVFLCFLVDLLRGGGIPFYSAIAAILCMQRDLPSGWKAGRNRTVGTLLGGGYGLLVLLALRAVPWLQAPLAAYLAISLGLIPLMYLTVALERTPATYITCVVYLSVVVSHGADQAPVAFALGRVVDTLLGNSLSLGVNALPRGRRKSHRN